MANYEHPPLVKYLLGAYMKICYPNAHMDYGSQINDLSMLFCARLFCVFMGAISIIPLYFIAEKIASNLGIPASIFFALNPSHARLSGLAYLDVPMIFFGLCSIVATLNLLEETSLKTVIVCGVTNGLLIGTKWIQPILFIIPMLVFIAVFHRKKLPAYVLTWTISLTTLLLLWFPLIYQLGLNLIPLINNHWINQIHITERSFIEVISWNVTVAELMIYIFCFVVTAILLALKFKNCGEPAENLLPIISICIILTALYLESRKAVYYWTPITAFTSLLLAQTLFLCSELYQRYDSKK
ncbi:MAG: glycosyltransferase family 39 protein [Candidatus Bathyarchaeia archaeon]